MKKVTFPKIPLTVSPWSQKYQIKLGLIQVKGRNKNEKFRKGTKQNSKATRNYAD